MWRTLYRACSSSTKNAATRSPLAVLRRKTGFPLNKCRQALDSCKNDVEEAEKWLHAKAVEEGWQRTESLSGREAKQGLIGAAVVGNRVVALEINCETDFVARTDDFKDLVAAVTTGITKLADVSNQDFCTLFQNDPGALGPIDGYSTVKDALVKTIGKVSENVVLSRGCVLSAREGTNGVVSSFVYDDVLKTLVVSAGKFVSLVHLRPESDCSLSELELTAIGTRVGQHIVGLNPKLIGRNGNGTSDSTGVLVNQPFLFDSSCTVGEMLSREKVAITSFVRVGAGEKTQVVDSEVCTFLSFN